MPTNLSARSKAVRPPGTTRAPQLSAAIRLLTERHAHSEDAAFDALLDDARRHHISLAAAAKNALARHIPQSPAEPDTPLGGDTAHLPQGTVTLSDSRSGTASLGS